MALKDDLLKLKEQALQEIHKAGSREELETVRVAYLGRKGKLTAILRQIGTLPTEEKPVVGQLANEVRTVLEEQLAKKSEELEIKELEAQLEAEALDITLPGKRPRYGHKHLITQVIEDIVDVFIRLGYQVAEGPEVELDWYNFEALNTPPDHPARSLQDTFYIKTDSLNHYKNHQPHRDDVLLRTHTSPVQIRVMEKQKPPIYIVCPGKAFRRDVADPSHSPMFHQVEGLVVDKGITFGDLKGTLETFVKEIFGPQRQVRLRPHFFPFTEPSAEVDVSCIVCGGKGCRTCGGQGWLEILGCGLVDPNVLANVGINAEEYSGFAFGMGVERIAMLKYGVNDIRLFFENDLRFLRQF